MIPFEQVVRDHAAVVFRVCRAILPPHDAEDAWSETFLAALRAYPELDPATNLEAWLVTVAHRKAIDVTRRRRSEPLAQLPEQRTEASEPHPVWDLVADLALKQRQVIAYRYIAGMPYAEIAALIGGTPEAARRAGADGVKRLRTRLSGRRPLWEEE